MLYADKSEGRPQKYLIAFYAESEILHLSWKTGAGRLPNNQEIAAKNRLMPKALQEQGEFPALIYAGQVVPLY
ncbi:MAG: hypothetical protein NC320_13045 [Clostridium sp.]|nr:hypothetical protein [Clostridium sp.]